MIVLINNYFFLTKKGSKRVYTQKNDSSGKQSDPGNFSKSQFVIFQVSKIFLKRVYGNDRKNLP